MRKYILLAVALWFSFSAKAQIGLTFSDTTICRGETITMGASLTGQVSNIAQDDIFSNNVIPLGFDFEYYGVTFSSCVISANNFISFDTTLAGQFSAWTWGSATSNGNLKLAVMLGFQDLYPPAGGTIKYQTFGTPGSRRFVVEYCQLPKFAGSCEAYKVTNQVILYEGTNIIEFHTTSMPGTPGCPSTNAAPANGIQGLHYQVGAINNTLYTPNRGPTDNWGGTVNNNGTNTSRRYTPISASPYYQIDSIPFNPWAIIENIYSGLLMWYDANGNFLGQGASITVTPTNPPVPAPGTFYTVSYTGKAGCDTTLTYTFVDTVNVHYNETNTFITAEMCAGSTYTFNGRLLYAPGVYRDTFVTPRGCDSVIILTLGVNPLPNVTFNENAQAKICQGDRHLFRAVKQNGVTYQWLRNGNPINGATFDTFSTGQAGTYSIKITTSKGCTDTSKQVQLVINPNPTVDINYVSRNDFCAMDTVTLRGTATGNNLEYIWSPEDYFRVTGTSNIFSEVRAIIPESGYVKLKVFNSFLCSATDSVFIKVQPCCEIGMPNAFTPNGDGRNDNFKPVLQVGQTIITFQVYNRRGQLIYNNENPRQGWNGTDQDGNIVGNDVYMYRIEYNCSDGKVYQKKGDVTVMR